MALMAAPLQRLKTTHARRHAPACLKVSLYCLAILGCFSGTLQDAKAFVPSSFPSVVRPDPFGTQKCQSQAAVFLGKGHASGLARRLSHTSLGLRSYLHNEPTKHAMTRRGVLVLGPLAALGFACWQSRDLVAAETVVKVKEATQEGVNKVKEAEKAVFKEFITEKKNITAEDEVWMKGNITLFKEKFEGRKKAAKTEIDTLRKQVDKRNTELINDLTKIADKAEDPELKQQLLKEVQDFKLQTLEENKLKKWTTERLNEAKERLGNVLLENEELVRRVDEILPLDIVKEDVKGDSMILSFPVFGGLSVVKKTISLEQVAKTGLVAGSVGEVLKDVISFPLDTIRTRLMTQGSFEAKQQQQQPPAKAKKRPATPSPSAFPRLGMRFEARRGRRALMVGELPPGTQRVTLPKRNFFGGIMEAQRKVQVGSRRVMRSRVARQLQVPAGLIRGVYKGVTAVLLASPIQGAAFFTAKELIKKAAPMYGLSAMQTFLAGIVIADAAYWIVRCPAETIKTRVQTGIDANWLESLQSIVSTQGLKGLYGAYVPLLQLDFPFTAVNFALYSGIQAYVEALNNAPPTLQEQFAIGFVCSAFTAGITTPLSVATTRILMDSGGGAKSEEEMEEMEEQREQLEQQREEKTQGESVLEGVLAVERQLELQLGALELKGSELQAALENQREAVLALLSGKQEGEGTGTKKEGEGEGEGEGGGLQSLLAAAQQRVQAAPAAEEEAAPVPGRRYEKMGDTIRTIYSEEGASALLKGILPRMAQLGLNHALRFSAYDAARKAMVNGFLEGF